MCHGLQSKSLLVSETFARGLLCLNRAGSMLNITRQWQETLNFGFFFGYGSKLLKISHLLKPLVPKVSF